MFDLTGRTALVTGATGGIGAAIAQALHGQGATVAISGTRREVLDSFAGKLGERVHVLPCNLSDSAEVEALVPKLHELKSGPRFANVKIDGANIERILPMQDGTYIVNRIRGSLGFAPI